MGFSFLFYFLAPACFGGSSFIDNFRYDSDLEGEILKSWVDQKELPVDIVTALLVAEGLHDEVKLGQFRQKLAALEAELKKKSSPKHDKTARNVYRHLHAKVLLHYQPHARFQDVLNMGSSYNCVTSTSLFAVICRDLGIPIVHYVTPNHIYCAVKTGGKEIRVEMTDPKKGFNFKTSIKQSLNYLKRYKLVTDAEIREKGERIIYRDFVDGAKIIPIEGLLAASYYNQAYTHVVNKRYEPGVLAAAKSLLVNPNDKQTQSILQHGITSFMSSYEAGNKSVETLAELAGIAVHFFGDDLDFINHVLDGALYVVNMNHVEEDAPPQGLDPFFAKLKAIYKPYAPLIRKITRFQKSILR